MKFSSVAIFLVFSSHLALCQSAKILGVFTTFSPSHLIIHMSVIRTAIERGHDVTVVTTLPLKEPANKNFRHILIDAPGPPKELMTGMIKNSTGLLSGIYHMLGQTKYFLDHSNTTINDPQLKKLMAEESFDLLIIGYFFNDFQFGLAAHFKCPYIISFMNRPLKAMNNWLGNPSEMFYVPHVMIGVRQPLGFFDRIKNLFAYAVETVMFWMIDFQFQKYYEFNFPADRYPDLNEVRKNVSLMFSCHHFSNTPIKPNVPALVDIGGVQVKPKPDRLPEDVGKFLAGASNHGAIFFSLGSNARSADMDPDTIRTVYQVLSKLKQRVIWKWEEDATPGNASNILFRKWLPQDDILADPSIKLFITHGGHGSVVESEYHGVPMVGMPLFGDQFANLDAVHNAGYGISLGKQKLTEEIFRNAVLEVLEKPKYRENVRRFSQLYRDRPISARDTAAFWIEYVIRHRGAKHLQSPAVHLNTIQYYGLDVIAFLVAVAYVVWKIVKGVFKLLLSLVCRLKKGNVQDKKDYKKKKVQ